MDVEAMQEPREQEGLGAARLAASNLYRSGRLSRGACKRRALATGLTAADFQSIERRFKWQHKQTRRARGRRGR